MRWLAAFVFVLQSARADGRCDAALSRINARINAAWPALYPNRLTRNLIRYAILPGRRPCRLVEAASLLDDGRWPAVDAGAEFRFVRTSRAAGLDELRRSLDLGTEWSYVFVPALGAWVNDTVAAGPGSVAIAGSLHQLLQAAFGPVECFHTHPWIALTTLGGADRWPAHQRLVHLGLPSPADFETMLELVRRESTAPGVISSSAVVHPLGVTTYAIEWRRAPGGAIHPFKMPRITRSHFVSGHYPQDPEKALRQVLERAVGDSRGADSSPLVMAFEPH